MAKKVARSKAKVSPKVKPKPKARPKAKAKPKPAAKAKTRKHPGGRPTKYRPEFCKEIIAYFDIEPVEEVPVIITMKNGGTIEKTEERPNHLKFLHDFAASIGVTHGTMLNWTEEHPEFLEAYTRAKELQANHLHTCGLLGLFNPGYAKFTAINMTDWKSEKTEVSGECTVVVPGISFLGTDGTADSETS